MRTTFAAGWGLVLLGLVLSLPAAAQNLRYDNHREVAVPEYATFRLGPFYSSMQLQLTAGYRYVTTTGNGGDYLFENQRGAFLKDGSDFPMIATLNTRNYVALTRHADLDVSVSFSYEFYLLNTQQDAFYILLPEEGISANLSTELAPWSFTRWTLYDSIAWRTDYIDTRGVTDRYGGRKYQYLANTVGLKTDWLLADDRDMGVDVCRADNIPLEDGWDDQEYTKYGGTLMLEQKIANWGVIGPRADFEYALYKLDTRPDTFLQNYGAFATLQLTERTRFNAAAGYAMGSVTDRKQTGDTGEDRWRAVVGSVGLETELSETLSHGITAGRGMRSGWRTGFEIRDEAGYRIDWVSELLKANVFTRVGKVAPKSDAVNGYTDWTSGAGCTVPLLDYLDLLGSTTYAIRYNDTKVAVPGEAPESQYDYTTWASRIGLQLAASKEFRFLTYVEHVDRNGDTADLDYTRDVFAALLTYTHDF